MSVFLFYDFTSFLLSVLFLEKRVVDDVAFADTVDTKKINKIYARVSTNQKNKQTNRRNK